jgi:hypothetical protein
MLAGIKPSRSELASRGNRVVVQLRQPESGYVDRNVIIEWLSAFRRGTALPPKQRQQDDYRNRYPQQPEKNSSAHDILL